jgi:ketosteroid isomerase-like protein
VSDENVELVRKGWDLFQAGLVSGDSAGAIFDGGFASPDFEWIPPAVFPGARIYRGREGFDEFVRTWMEEFEDLKFELREVIDAGDDRCVVIAHQMGTGKRSGAPVELDLALVYELKDGRAIRCTNYATAAEALEAAGIAD